MSSARRDDDGHIDDQSGICTGRTLFVTEQACVHVVRGGVYLYAQRSRDMERVMERARARRRRTPHARGGAHHAGSSSDDFRVSEYTLYLV